MLIYVILPDIMIQFPSLDLSSDNLFQLNCSIISKQKCQATETPAWCPANPAVLTSTSGRLMSPQNVPPLRFLHRQNQPPPLQRQTRKKTESRAIDMIPLVGGPAFCRRAHTTFNVSRNRENFRSGPEQYTHRAHSIASMQESSQIHHIADTFRANTDIYSQTKQIPS